MRKLFLFVLLLPYLSKAQPFNAELIEYTGKIFRQAATGQIAVYDSLMRKLPADSLYHRFVSAKPYMANNINDNYYTRNTFTQAAFINGFHYGLFEGQLGLPDLPSFLFDTLTYKANSNYIVFRLYRYNDVGVLKDKKKLFIVNRNATLINKKVIQERAQKAAADSVNRNRVKMLTTGENGYWKIETISVNKKKVDLDICQQLYRLKLYGDMKFEQVYSDTTSFTINRKAGADAGVERAFYFINEKTHVQCYLENESGIWTVKGNKLILMTYTGIVLNNYTIVSVSVNKATAILRSKNYEIALSKHPL